MEFRSVPVWMWIAAFLGCFIHNRYCIAIHEPYDPNLTPTCHKMLEQLAGNASAFIACAVRQATTPFRFCRHCEHEYTSVYIIRTEIYDQDYGCVEELVQSEKYQIVSKVYDFVTSLWSGSHCDNCYKNLDNSKWELRRDVNEFFHIKDALYSCFTNNSKIPLFPISNSSSNASRPSNSSNVLPVRMVCSLCQDKYLQLQKAYRKAAGVGEHGDLLESSLCADVVSAMNFTRQRWSHEFRCVRIQKDLVSVVALTVFFCFLPVIFYTAAKMNGDAAWQRKAGKGLPKINYDSE